MMSGGPIDLDRRISDLKSRRFRDAKAVPDTPAWISTPRSAYFRSGSDGRCRARVRRNAEGRPEDWRGAQHLAVVFMLTGRYPQAEAEIKAAEKSGFRVNPQLKQDLKKASGRN